THSRRSGEGRSPDPLSSLRRRPESRLTLVAPAKAGVQTHTRRSGEGRSPNPLSSLRRRPEPRLTLVAPAKAGVQTHARITRHALVPFPRTVANARTHASTPWRQATFLVLCEARSRALPPEEEIDGHVRIGSWILARRLGLARRCEVAACRGP